MSGIASRLSRSKLTWTNHLRHRNYTPHSRNYGVSSARTVKDRPPYKRLVVCCDGTWQSSNDDASKPTNVTLFSRAIQTSQQMKDGTEIQQVVLYQPGIGTGAMGVMRRLFAGGLGFGLTENVTEVYMFLANNFEEEDEVFLFGYSRGAYTARAVAGLINSIGLLKKSSLHKFQDIYRSFQMRGSDPVKWKKCLENIRPRDQNNQVKIKVIGCWDTVGSLGLPETFLGKLLRWNDKYKFHDTRLFPIIENAFHCLALDERRRSFAPTLWHLPQQENREGPSRGMDSGTTAAARSEKFPPPTLRQIWMIGFHADVGGDRPFAKSALEWMIAQCRPFLTFDDNYIDKKLKLYSKPALASPLRDSLVGIFHLHGSKYRTPGEYTRNDTKEMVHHCVWERMEACPEWRPRALRGFKRVRDEGGFKGRFKWVKAIPSSQGVTEGRVELPEY